MLLLLMRGCDIAASAYNAAATPATANATNAMMLIMLLMLMWGCSSAYNAGAMMQLCL